MRSLSPLPRLAVAFTLASLPILGARAAPAFNAPADVKSLTAIETALATQTDMSKLIGDYAPKAVVADIAAPPYHGRAAINAAFTQQLATLKSMHTDMGALSIASDGTLACVALTPTFTMVLKSGANLTVTTRQLDAFRKIHGAWQIEQEQISVPMDPKTGLAAMNAPVAQSAAMPWNADLVAGPATTPAKAKAEIRAWVVDGSPIVDIDKMVALFAPADQALLYDLTTPGQYRGVKAIHDDYAPLLVTLSGAKDQLLDFTVDSDGKLAVQIDTQNLQIIPKSGPTKIISFRQSDCLTYQGGKWLSFAEMLSFPADYKTGKSITVDPAASFK
jgi:ketosteroid isomerase-like protein